MTKAYIEDETGDIVIRMSQDVLRSATELCPRLELFDYTTKDYKQLKVTDIDAWRQSVVRELNIELGDDGTTLVHVCFDDAFFNAYESGSDGIEEE